MGQYYKAVSIESKQFMCGSFLKLMETSYIGNKFLNSVESLLVNDGAWYKTRIVWAGDYMDENIFLTSKQISCRCKKCREDRKHRDTHKDTHKITLYRYAENHFAEVKPSTIKHIREYRFILNHSKNMYVDLHRVIKDEYGYRIHPLPILTCSGNDRGGGDFHETETYPHLISSWAGDIISVEEKKPVCSSEIIPHFREWSRE